MHFLHERVEGRGLKPRPVADRHDLDIADVYGALAYYHEHPEEMAEIERRRQRRHEDAVADPSVVTGPDDVDESQS